MNRKLKTEFRLAVALAVSLSLLTVYVDMPRNTEPPADAYLQNSRSFGPGVQDISSSSIQQVISENIQGELRKDGFETTVQDIKTLVSGYGGRIPALHMGYENELWSGALDCRLPTDNVTSFTFDVRKLINDHGKVTHISIDVNEVEVNQTQAPETALSEISMCLRDKTEGASPFLDQLGAILLPLATGLVWVGEGLFVGTPLCFVSLGVVIIVNRGILPVWKKQFRNKSLAKEKSESVSS